jgi:MFS family permease
MGNQEENEAQLGFRNVIRLGYVSLLTDVSSEMIFAVLPIFIVTQLGATVGVLGIIEGTAEAFNNLLRIFSGILTDRMSRRKPLVLLGYGLSSFAKPLFAVATSWTQAFAVRVTDRAGKGMRTSPRDALISDSIKKSQAGRAFGVHESLDQVGAVLGPLVAFVAIPFIAIRGIFWLSFIPGLGSLIILLFFVKDSRRSSEKSNVFASARIVLNREFVVLLVVLSVFAVGAYDYSFILLDASALGVNVSGIPLVYTVLNLATVIISVPVGMLADRIGKAKTLIIGYLLFLVTSAAGLILSGSWVYAFLIAFLFGGYFSISDSVSRALIPDFTKPELKGTAYALYYVMVGICALVSNSAFGFLWTAIGRSVAFEYSIVTSLIGAATLIVFITARKPTSR